MRANNQKGVNDGCGIVLFSGCFCNFAEWGLMPDFIC